MKKWNLGYVYLLITILLFSTYEVVSKTIAAQISPFQLNFVRFFLGGLVLLVILLIRGQAAITKKQALQLLLLGTMNTAIVFNLMQYALALPGASAAVGAVIFSSNPIFVNLFAALIEKERISVSKVVGLAIGVIGISVVFLDKFSVGASAWLSPLLVLLAAIGFGLYSVLGRKIVAQVGSMRMNAYSFLFGSLVMVPFLLIAKIPVITFDLEILPKILYLAIFVTGIAYLTYFLGLAQAGASKGSLVFFLKPVFASFIAVIFLNEKLSLTLVLGTLLVLMGIGVALFGERIRKPRM